MDGAAGRGCHTASEWSGQSSSHGPHSSDGSSGAPWWVSPGSSPHTRCTAAVTRTKVMTTVIIVITAQNLSRYLVLLWTSTAKSSLVYTMHLSHEQPHFKPYFSVIVCFWLCKTSVISSLDIGNNNFTYFVKRYIQCYLLRFTMNIHIQICTLKDNAFCQRQ